MAGAAVVTAMIGPGGTATATEEETAMVAVGGPVLLGAVVATAELTVTSEDAEQAAGANTVLLVHSALCGREAPVMGAPTSLLPSSDAQRPAKGLEAAHTVPFCFCPL